MFAAGRPDQRTIASAAATAGLDIPRAQRIIADPRVEAELRRNAQYAHQLELEGTPGWLIGDQVLFGAVGKDNLARAIAESVR